MPPTGSDSHNTLSDLVAAAEKLSFRAFKARIPLMIPVNWGGGMIYPGLPGVFTTLLGAHSQGPSGSELKQFQGSGLRV